jgi:hypothetical protein
MYGDEVTLERTFTKKLMISGSSWRGCRHLIFLHKRTVAVDNRTLKSDPYSWQPPLRSDQDQLGGASSSA